MANPTRMALVTKTRRENGPAFVRIVLTTYNLLIGELRPTGAKRPLGKRNHSFKSTHAQ